MQGNERSGPFLRAFKLEIISVMMVFANSVEKEMFNDGVLSKLMKMVACNFYCFLKVLKSTFK